MDLIITNLADRPDLAPLLDRFPPSWPAFMYHDPLAPLAYDRATTALAEFCLVAVDRDAPDVPVAKAYSVPCSLPESDADLPPGGWDAVMLAFAEDQLRGRRGNRLCAVEVSVRPELRGRGLSPLMLQALRRNAAARGYGELLVSLRPTGKHRHPHVPMAEYVARTRPDGLPEDPWLRVHVRAGGRVVGVAPLAMTITGTLAQWRSWTGLPFDTDGPVLVPEALVPVHCDVAADHAVYVEPNVWVVHRT
ncbi:MAG TPA: N-acetyltransferase [Pilimelia sp.]|nr:N-acetyltransferase [Pilimelia sp.]